MIDKRENNIWTCDQCGIQFDYKKEGFVDAGFGCCKPCWEKLMQTLAG